MEEGIEPAVGEHSYSGSCAPGQSKFSRFQTFSVGVFEWLPKASGKGLKKSKVKVRISGSSSQPDIVYREAERVAYALDKGTYKGPKNVRM